MSEIDDNYAQRGEDSDLKFFGDIKSGIGRNAALKNFLDRSGKSRKAFKKDYAKFLEKERKKATTIKRKKEKRVKFDRLKVKHFDFRFGFLEKKKMWVDILWFNFVRKYWKYWNLFIPKWLFYVYYKITCFTKNTFIDIKDFIWNTIFWIKDFITKVSNEILVLMKKSYRVSLLIFRKIMFWKKRGITKKEEGGKNAKEEKEEIKKDEEKNIRI